jgi:VanZ family protein
MNTITVTFIQNRTVWLLLSIGLAVTVAVLTLMPQASMPVGPQGIDKVYHMVAFAALIFPTAMLRPKRCLAAGCLAILYGGMIEVIQPAFGRSADMSDLLADVLGVATGIFLGLAARRILLERRSVL